MGVSQTFNSFHQSESPFSQWVGSNNWNSLSVYSLSNLIGVVRSLMYFCSCGSTLQYCIPWFLQPMKSHNTKEQSGTIHVKHLCSLGNYCPRKRLFRKLIFAWENLSITNGIHLNNFNWSKVSEKITSSCKLSWLYFWIQGIYSSTVFKERYRFSNWGFSL